MPARIRCGRVKIFARLVLFVCKERGLGMEIPTDWFLQDIRD